MAVSSNELSPEHRDFIARQSVFFVATAPLAGSGHVNLSPKGLDTLRVLGERRLAYLDLTGSGNETAAHVAENGRIAFLWCAFEGAPRLLRVHGRAHVVTTADAEWEALRAAFPPLAGARQIVVADVLRVATSCGFGVPTFSLVRPRDELLEWARTRGPEGLAAYRARKNQRSLDGLTAPNSDPPPPG